MNSDGNRLARLRARQSIRLQELNYMDAEFTFGETMREAMPGRVIARQRDYLAAPLRSAP